MTLNDATLYYSFDDADLTSGNPDDLSGNGNNGTTNGATTGATGKINEGFSYDGTNDYVSTSLGITAQSNVSFVVWFNWDGDTASQKELMGNFTSGGSFGYNLYIDTDSKVKFSVDGAATSVDTAAISSGTWYHVVATYEHGTTTATIYLNTTSTSASRTATASAGGNINFGRAGDANTWYFDGDIDESGYYARVLSGTEVSDSYNGGTGINPYASVTPGVLGVTSPTSVNGVDSTPSVNGVGA